MTDRKSRIDQLHAAAKERILLLDGSWGVMFQRMGLEEADYRGERFDESTYPGQMKGNNDILCLTRPERVTELHNAYYAAGADISETNTFSATTIAQDDYALDLQSVIDINFEGAKLARAGGVTMPIVPGIMLQPNFNGLARMAKVVEASVPDWLHKLYEGTDDEPDTRELITANVAVELCHKLSEQGVNDFHFYTLNRANLALSTCRLLGLKPKAQSI